jgi:transposase
MIVRARFVLVLFALSSIFCLLMFAQAETNDAQLQRGLRALQAQDFAGADQAFLQLVQRAPTADNYNNLATAEAAAGQVGLAIGHLQRSWPVLRCPSMRAPLVPDALWNLIQPLLPLTPRRPLGGRPRVPDRSCLPGILFVLRSGIPWEMLPQELGCGSGMTCWRRLRDWQEAGIWQLIHFVLLDWLARCGQIDWSRAVVDGSSVRAVFGGSKPVQIPPTGPSLAASVI